jgi:hypothetical protein
MFGFASSTRHDTDSEPSHRPLPHLLYSDAATRVSLQLDFAPSGFTPRRAAEALSAKSAAVYAFSFRERFSVDLDPSIAFSEPRQARTLNWSYADGRPKN